MYIKRITGECYGIVCLLKSHYNIIDNGLVYIFFLSQPFKPKPYPSYKLIFSEST